MDCAASPRAVPARISARSISPVEIAGIFSQFVMSRDCVPLPQPGGPKSSRTNKPPLNLSLLLRIRPGQVTPGVRSRIVPKLKKLVCCESAMMEESKTTATCVQSSKAASAYSVVEREITWRSYLDRIRQGDQDALAALYDQTSSLVFGIAQRVLDSRADAE